MVRSLSLLVLSAFFVTSARADLQLSPRVSETWVDGAKIRLLVFSDGSGKEATYGPPTGWDYSGSSAKLTLYPPGKPQAQGSISTIGLHQPAVFDAETMKKLAAEALASVPEEGTVVALVSQEKNPFFIAGKETFLVIVSYTFYGEKYERSMMFLNRGNEQVRFQFVSRAVDFKNLQTAFQGSQLSWRNL
jgi:hypothetical protein